MGYALIGLAAGTQIGVRGVLVYLLTYVVMSAGSFACIVAMRRRGLAAERISDLGGLAKNDLTLAALLAIFMFSMAGLPPMAGFFGKLLVFQAAIDAGMYTLAIIGVLTSVPADHQGDVFRSLAGGIRPSLRLALLRGTGHRRLHPGVLSVPRAVPRRRGPSSEGPL
jgi:hypothetical protein